MRPKLSKYPIRKAVIKKRETEQRVKKVSQILSRREALNLSLGRMTHSNVGREKSHHAGK